MTVDLDLAATPRPIHQVAAEGWACALAYTAIQLPKFDVPCDCGRASSNCTWNEETGRCD